MKEKTRTTLSNQTPEINRVFALQKAHALNLRHSTAQERITKLKRLRAGIAARREAFHAALKQDLNRPQVEVDLNEVLLCLQSAESAAKKVKKWMKPRRVPFSAGLFGTFSHVRQEPLGVCLIIAPWNFPVNLLLKPLISAIAAGNTVIVKPSEFSPATNAVMRDLFNEVFSEEDVAMFEGEAEVAQDLLAMPFDHIFFTGSPAVGKLVMGAAAKNLSSVTLELGGKSPVVIDPSADLKKAARSLAFGKHQNAGQICIAPDYLFVHESIQAEFTAELKQAIEDFIGQGDAQKASSDYGRIINSRHAERIKFLLDEALKKGAKLEFGGDSDIAERWIQPTALSQIPTDAKILEEEIFGPLFPILSYNKLDEAIEHINAKPKPLALYVYSQDEQMIEHVLTSTSSGNAGVNTCCIHYAEHNLPFGGVNNSGIGKSNGYYGFKAFSNEKGVIRNRFALLSLFAPPYTDKVKKLAALAVRYL